MKLTHLLWGVTQLVGCLCLSDYGGVEVDPISGELVKPEFMSDERFKLIKLLRIKDMMTEHMLEERDEMDLDQTLSKKSRRVKRATKEGSTLPVTLSQGFYKQESMVLERFGSLSPSPTPPPAADRLRVGEYIVNSSTSRKLGFFIKKVGGVDSVEVRELTGVGWSSPLTLAAGSQSFNQLLDLAAVPGAAISDLILMKHPRGGKHYVCITVDYALEYPREPGTSPMEVNTPVHMPNQGKSSIFTIALLGSTYSVKHIQYLETIQAKDAESWIFDDHLYVAVAQTGNTTTPATVQQSVLYVQKNPALSTFDPVLGFQRGGAGGLDPEYLPTNAAVSVRHVEFNARSFLIFASSGTGGLVDTNTSPVYKYSYNTANYELWQNLPSFGARDVAFLDIPDAYPIHSKLFLIFSNYKEVVGGVGNFVDSVAYSLSDGKFIPFQSIPVKKSVSVVAHSHLKMAVADTDLPSYNVRKLDHAVVFLSEDGDITISQFDGVNFIVDSVMAKSTGATPATRLNLVDLAIPGGSYSPTLVEDVAGGGASYIRSLLYLDTSSMQLYQYSAEKLKLCLQQRKIRDESINYADLHHIYQNAPKKSNLDAMSIAVKDLTFSETTTLSIVSGDLNAKYNQKTLLDTSAASQAITLAVGGLQTIDNNYLDKLHLKLESIAMIKLMIDNFVTAYPFNTVIMTNGPNTVTSTLQINSITGSELAGGSVVTNSETPAPSITSATGSILSVDDLQEQMVIINGSHVNPLVGIVFHNTPQFENISIQRDYNIAKLDGHPVTEYVATGVDPEVVTNIAGKLILKAGATFTESVTLTGKVNNESVLSSTGMLLKSGDQDFTQKSVFKVFTNFSALNVNTLNGVDMTIMLKSLNVEDIMVVPIGLTVNDLIVQGNVNANIGVLDATTTLVETINLPTLVDESMSKTKDNVVELEHRYEQLISSADSTAALVSGLVFPDAFININDSSNTLVHRGDFFFSNLQFVDGGRLHVHSQLSSPSKGGGQNAEILVDNGVLDILLTSADHPSNYSSLVIAPKTFNTMTLQMDSTVSGQLLGFNVGNLNSFVQFSIIPIEESVSISEVTLTGNVMMSNLKIIDLINTNCGSLTGCVSNNLEKIYLSGVPREVVSIPPGLTTIAITEAIFEQNVNVTTVNGVNPEADFLMISGNLPRVFTKDISFTSPLVFTQNIEQLIGATVKSCLKNLNEDYLCQLDADGTCCQSDFLSCQCSLVKGDCVLKSGIKKINFCEAIVSEDLRTIEQNSLRFLGETFLQKPVIFRGGFTADYVEVTEEDCFINDISCSEIASTIYPDTFTGINTIFGSLIADGVTHVSEDLQVDGQVDGVDVTSMYMDSVFINSQAPQTVTGSVTAQRVFSVESFTSTGVDVGAVSSSSLTDMSNHVLNVPGSSSVCGDIVFLQSVDATSITTDTFNNVGVEEFYTKKWTKDPQTLIGPVTVSNDASFHRSLTGKFDNGTINSINLKKLSTEAVSITDSNDITLNDVRFEALWSFNDLNGIHVTNEFLGLRYPEEVVTLYNKSPLVIANKTFLSDAVVKGDLNVLSNEWTSEDQTDFVNAAQFFHFQDNDNLNKVEVFGNLNLANEPLVNNLNSEPLSTIRDTFWYSPDVNSINSDIKFNDIEINGVLNMFNENAFINGIDLLNWKANYLSLSRDQSISGDYTFVMGLKTDAPLSVPSLTVKSGDTELPITAGSNIFKIEELSTSILLKASNYSEIKTKLRFNQLLVPANIILQGSQLINGIDLSQDVLTFIAGDNKVFTNKVSMNGNLLLTDLQLVPDSELTSLPAARILHPSLLSHSQEHSGLLLQDGVLALELQKVLENGVDPFVNEPASVGGNKIFSGSVSLSSLNTDFLVQGVDVGSCLEPNILLTVPCNGNPQVISGFWEFGTGSTPVEVHVGQVKGIQVLNSVVLEDLLAKVVLKSDTGPITITAPKTFSNALKLNNATFTGTLLGLQFDTLIEKTLRTADMEYRSGAVLPDLNLLMAEVKKEAADVPLEFIYTPLLGWTGAGSTAGRMFSLLSSRDNNPFKLAGFDLEGSSGSLKIFPLVSSNLVAATQIHPLLQLDATFTSSGPGGVHLVSIPTAEGERILVYTGVEITNTEADPADPPAFEVAAGTETAALNSVLLSFSGNNTRLLQRTLSTISIQDLVSVKIADKDCIVVCQGQTDVTVHCLDADMVFQLYQTLVVPSCYKVSATPSADIVGQATTAYIAVGVGEGLETVAVYSAQGTSTFQQVESVAANTGTSFSIVDFTGPRSLESQVFMTLVSPGDLQVAVLVGSTFQSVDLPPVELPLDASFHKWDGSLVLSVLHGDTTRSTVANLVYRGELGFVPENHERIDLRGVHQIQPVVDFNNKDRYLLTTGVPTTSPIPSTAVYRYIYKENSVDAYRTEFRSKPSPPSFLTLDCESMVHGYINRLYAENSLPVDGFNVEKMGELLLRLMPRKYVSYRTDDFSSEVRAVLEDPTFQALLDRSPPTGVANLYLYLPDGSRPIADQTFAGSMLVYQDVDQLLYLYTRLRSVTNQFRAVSFWTNCTGGTQIPLMTYAGTGVSTGDVDGSTVHQCSMVHALDPDTSAKLNSLDNKSVGGAIVVHTDGSTSSDRYACGYIKNVDAAKLQFHQDHSTADINYAVFN